MKKAKNWIIGLTIVALLALGVAALGSGFRGGAATSEQVAPLTCGGQDHDDETMNCADADWSGQGTVCGGGARLANGQGLCGARLQDGSEIGRRSGGMGPGRGCGM